MIDGIRATSDTVGKLFKELPENERQGKYTAREIASIKTRARTTLLRYQDMHESVTQYEEQHNITTRLTIGTPEYAAAKKNVAVFRYRKAVAELERLVVQRLLELTKLNVSGVGEFQDGHEKIKV
jgi:hypothetical protein